jgi:hypothetical protein
MNSGKQVRGDLLEIMGRDTMDSHWTPSIKRGAARISVFLVILITSFGSIGCRSEIKVQKAGGGKLKKKAPPKGEPISINDSLTVNRSYLQSRQSIALEIKDGILNEGDLYSLINDTKSVKVVDKAVVQAGLYGVDLTPNTNFELENTSAWLKFNPYDEGFNSKFDYGTQDLSLKIDDGKSGKLGKFKITRKDFTIFSVGTSSYQTADTRTRRFEGSPATVEKPVLTNGSHTMTLDFVPIISR